MTSVTWELTSYEQHRKPHETLPGNTEIAVSPYQLHSDLQCPICLDILSNTMTTKECLHRFCSDCITTALRNGNKECPTCRKKLVSHRSLRKDTTFDAIVAKIFPDRSLYEEQVEKRIAKLMQLHVNDRYAANSEQKNIADEESDSHSADESAPSNFLIEVNLKLHDLSEIADEDLAFFGSKFFNTASNASIDHLIEFLRIRYKAFYHQKTTDSNVDVSSADLSSIPCNYQLSIHLPSKNNDYSPLDGQKTLAELCPQSSAAVEPIELLYLAKENV